MQVRHRPGPWQLGAAIALLAVSYGVGFVRTAPARQALAVSPTRTGQFQDGRYSGWGSSPHGRIGSTVVIRRGRIVETSITGCRTRLSLFDDRGASLGGDCAPGS